MVKDTELSSKMSRAIMRTFILTGGLCLAVYVCSVTYPFLIGPVAHFAEMMEVAMGRAFTAFLSLSPGMLSIPPALVMAWTHTGHWSRLSWSGTEWVELNGAQPSTRALHIGTALGVSGASLCVMSLILGATNRSLVEGLVGILSLIPPMVLLVNKAKMTDLTKRLRGGKIFDVIEPDFVAFLSAVIAFAAILVLRPTLNDSSFPYYLILGVLTGFAASILLERLQLPSVDPLAES